MADVFVVTRARGRAWDWGRRMREQRGWDEHAAFMDGLVEDGLIVLGGPLGEGDGDAFLHVVAAASEASVRERLADDPWREDMLRTVSVRPWSVWLRAAVAPDVASLFVVAETRGPAWDWTRRRREQRGWDEHAAFMDSLVEEGLVVLGGPVGDGDGEEALLAVRADSESVIRERLAEDPWAGHTLVLASVRPWSLWLRGALPF